MQIISSLLNQRLLLKDDRPGMVSPYEAIFTEMSPSKEHVKVTYPTSNYSVWRRCAEYEKVQLLEVLILLKGKKNDRRRNPA